ncbi:MAG TPA: N-methyl-L-tryptophan oxidase [Micromonosporaceae bacterium]|nr:N-methyl-L-tryptophan oxidase [Micromonosporaceae bacterium]
MRADVIVVGLGSMGAATAYHLARRGASVLGLDRFTPPHDQGSHGGGSRIIRMAYAEGADYVPLLRRAYDLWGELERETGETLLTVTGGLMIGPAGGTTVGGALASAQEYQLDHELLDAAAVRQRFPAFTPADDEAGLYEEVAGLLRPEAAVRAYLRLAEAAGAQLRYGVPVTGWRATADGVVVSAGDGELAAARLVVSAGGWAPRLLPDVAAAVQVERRVQHYFRSPGPAYHPDRFPVWIWEYAPGAAAYGLPAVDGGGFTDAVKAAHHQVYDPVDPDLGAAPGEPAEGEVVREWLRSRLPELAKAPWLGGKQCLYSVTPDEHFIVGRHPAHEQVAVAAGFSGHGFKFAPVIGEILADLALTGATGHPIGLFAPDRFARAGDDLVTSLPNA